MKNPNLSSNTGLLPLKVAAALFLSFIQPLSASDSGQASPDGAAEAIAAGAKLKAPDITISPSGISLKRQLDNDLQALGINTSGWDTKKERYVETTSVEIPIQASRATVENVVPLIFQANLIVGLRAMQKFTKWLGTKGDLELNLSIGSSPVGVLYEQHQQRFRAELSAVQEQLKVATQAMRQHRTAIEASASADQAVKKELDDKIEAMAEALVMLNKEANGNPATLTRINRALDAVMKKIDPSYDPTSTAANAQAKAQEAQAKIDAMKSERGETISAAGRMAREKMIETEKIIASLTTQVAEKKAEAESFFKEYTQDKLSNKFNWSAEYNITGLIPVKYYYGIVPGEKGALLITVAAAYAWSPATEREVRAVLLEDGLGRSNQPAISGFASYNKVLKKGDLPVDEWVRTQDPLTFGPARWYVDNEGEFHVLASAVVLKGQGSRASKSLSEVMARSEMALRMSLDVQFKNKGSLSDEDLMDENDSRVSTQVQDMMEAKSSSMLSYSSSYDGDDLKLKLKDGADSKALRFQIIKLSAKSVRDAYQAVLQQADTAAQAKLASARREGSRRAALDHVKAAEAKVPAARAEGYSKASADLAPKPVPTAPNAAGTKPSPKGSVEIAVGPAKDQSNAPVKTGVKKDNTPVPDFE